MPPFSHWPIRAPPQGHNNQTVFLSVCLSIHSICLSGRIICLFLYYIQCISVHLCLTHETFISCFFVYPLCRVCLCSLYLPPLPLCCFLPFICLCLAIGHSLLFIDSTRKTPSLLSPSSGTVWGKCHRQGCDDFLQ